MIITSTNRLIIREAQLSDALFFIDLMNTRGWLEHIGDRNIHALEDSKTYIKNSLIDSYQTNGYGLYVFEEIQSHHAIGIAGLVKRDTLDSPDLGFAVLPEAEGKSYAFEACTALLDRMKGRSNLKEILAITSPTNDRSKNLLVRLGFKLITNREPSNSLITYVYSY